MTLQLWLGVNPSIPYFDLQIRWDPTSSRWRYVSLSRCSGNQDFHFGWSKTADPSNLANGWCHFIVTTGLDLFDFPKLGHNTKYMIYGGNWYDTTLSGPPFEGAQILWIPKPANGVTTCTVPSTVGQSVFPLVNGDGVSDTFTPVPINTTSSAANAYVVSAY